jgi:hypothetical protein
MTDFSFEKRKNFPFNLIHGSTGYLNDFSDFFLYVRFDMIDFSI